MQDWLVKDWLVQDCTTKTAMRHALYNGLRKIFVQDGFCKTGLRYLICTTSFSFFVFPPPLPRKKGRHFYLGLPGCWHQYFSVKISSMRNLSPDVVYDSPFKWFMQHPCSPLPALLSEVVQVPEKLVANLCFGKSQPPSVKLRCNIATKNHHLIRRTGCDLLIFSQITKSIALMWILVRFFLNCQRFMCFPPTSRDGKATRAAGFFLPRCNLSSAPKVPGGAGSSFKSNWCASNNNSSSCPRCRVCRRGAFFLWKTPA